MPSRTATQKKAFSLVELSIVLVILGLLVGGILAGQSLIRAAELRAVTSEQGRYTTAISAFRDKYFSIPGDFSKASSFGWGSYDGDGDGVVEMSTASAGANEITTYWQHLASAGLIEGSYTPATGATMTAGTTNPRSKLSGASWSVYALGTALGSTGTMPHTDVTYFGGTYGNAYFFGAGTAAGAPTGIMKAEEAWNLDTKIDDGRPDLGTVLSLESQSAAVATGGTTCNNPAASSGASAVTFSYDLDSTSATACSLIMKTGY